MAAAYQSRTLVNGAVSNDVGHDLNAIVLVPVR